ENVIALYRTAGSLTENVDAAILSATDGADPEKVNMSKLF
ncbi:MAG: Uroporphyrinogen deCOase protein, partial [Bacteroidetes bacterium]|nr:Uroporphyrinogen deCOase protein [Bacteroidota bacterium]